MVRFDYGREPAATAVFHSGQPDDFIINIQTIGDVPFVFQ